MLALWVQQQRQHPLADELNQGTLVKLAQSSGRPVIVENRILKQQLIIRGGLHQR